LNMSKVRVSIVSGTVAVLAATAALSATPWHAAGHEYVYVQATRTKDIYVIDATSLEVVRNISIGDFTDDVIGSPDGRLAFANAQISSGNPLNPQLSEAGKVMAIDTATGKIVWSTFVDGVPHHLAVDPEGARVFVPLFDRNWLLVLDSHSGQILNRWYASLGNHGLEMSKDGKRLYVGSIISDVIWVYDTTDGQVISVLRAGEAVRPLKLDPDETHIVYQLSRFHGFKVRDLKSGEIRSIDLPPLSAGIELPDAFPFTVDHGLAFTPDHKKLLACGSIAGYVAVYSVPDYKLIGTINIGEDANWIAVRADSKIAFISNRGSNTVSVVDIDHLKEIKQIPVGKMPQRLSVIEVPAGS
jgi:YVTN family beta-propeller protein